MSLFYYRRMIKALHALHNPDPPAFIRNIYLDTSNQESMISDIRIDHVINSVGSVRVEAFNVDLNEEQIKNISIALKKRLTLIQGPPGKIFSIAKDFLSVNICVTAHLLFIYFSCGEMVLLLIFSIIFFSRYRKITYGCPFSLLFL